MSFVVAADSYDRFMGRYSEPLAPLFADFAGVAAPMKVLDVGCGPGALTKELVNRLDTGSVTAVDPSEPFVAAIRERFPDVVVQQASAEQLPFTNPRFDTALAQLVVHHMKDPVAGVAEMGRVTRSGGTVAACVWDFGGDRSPLSPFWRAVRHLDPSSTGESDFPGASEWELTRIFAEAGLEEVSETDITFEVTHQSFEEWWEPFSLGVGPAGRYLAQLASADRERIAGLCRQELPEAPFTLEMAVWAVVGRPRS